MSKALVQSKTFWVTIISVAAEIILLATNTIELTETVATVLLLINGSLAIVLRYLTMQPVDRVL